MPFEVILYFYCWYFICPANQRQCVPVVMTVVSVAVNADCWIARDHKPFICKDVTFWTKRDSGWHWWSLGVIPMFSKPRFIFSSYNFAVTLCYQSDIPRQNIHGIILPHWFFGTLDVYTHMCAKTHTHTHTSKFQKSSYKKISVVVLIPKSHALRTEEMCTNVQQYTFSCRPSHGAGVPRMATTLLIGHQETEVSPRHGQAK